MHNWFTIKVSYEKVHENGTQGKVTEAYLIDALSFTEAEARAIKELKPYITGEFAITDIKRTHLSELFFNESGDRYYRIKIFYITLDERTGAEKRKAAYILVQASTLKEAIANFEEGMKGTLTDYTIASVSEMLIMDIFPYTTNDNKEE